MTQAQTRAHNDTHGIVLLQLTPDKLAQIHLPLCLGAYLESHDHYRARMTNKALSLQWDNVHVENRNWSRRISG